MYCGKCGAKNDDNAAFCASCGAALKMKPPVGGGPVGNGGNPGGKNLKMIGIAAVIVVIAVVLAAAFLIVTRIFGSSYEKTATKFVTALYEMDAEGVMDLVPEELYDYLEEETGYDIDVLTEELEEQMESSMEKYWSYIDDVEFKSCEVTGDSDIKGTKLADKNELYEDCDIDISAAKTVRVKVKVEYYGEESKATFEIPVIKAGRKWYLDFLSLGNSLNHYYNF